MENKTKQLEYYCDKETFLKLKELNKHLTKSKIVYAAWYRAQRKTVYKKPIPDLSRYNLFIIPFTRGDFSFKTYWHGKRNSKLRWLKKDEDQESHMYEYFDLESYIYSSNLRKKKRGEEHDRDMLKEKWFYLDTRFIDESYGICKHPISDNNIIPPKLSKLQIEQLYEKLLS